MLKGKEVLVGQPVQNVGKMPRIEAFPPVGKVKGDLLFGFSESLEDPAESWLKNIGIIHISGNCLVSVYREKELLTSIELSQEELTTLLTVDPLDPDSLDSHSPETLQELEELLELSAISEELPSIKLARLEALRYPI
jgi:hypothetical protein